MEKVTRAARSVQVKNRAPAPIQITAEQIIVEARDRSAAQQPPPPQRHITDPQELAEHRLRVRKEFEDKLRMQRQHIGVWLRYAKWEESQGEIERARSVYERALDVDYKNTMIWMRYAEMEMKNKFVNRARNIWDRAVSLLPRVDTLWYKYTYMEELLGNINGARTIFERWMHWEPAEQAWLSYIKLEARANELDRSRAIYERYLACHPSQTSYMRFAKWEERNGQKALARRIFERSMEELRDDERDEKLYIAFAKFEERCKEMDRAKVIYKFGLEHLAKDKSADLYKEYVSFEKQHGERASVESVIISNRRAQYEGALAENPRNYDVWYDYIRLEESEGDQSRTREVYERAIANTPPADEKKYWRRYVFLWINYALHEELVAKDVDRTRAVYHAALRTLPHKNFTFAKLWLLAAKFEIRQKDLAAFRRLLGMALGLCPKEKIVKGYIALEEQLGNIDRCRKLYERYLQLWPSNVSGWIKFAGMERALGEDERVGAIYELAISQPALDMPEVAWKAYIDYEIELGLLSSARALYDRLLQRTQHIKVWLSYATFEASIAGDAEGARRVYSRAYDHFKGMGDEGKELRALLVETWLAFERNVYEDVGGSREALDAVAAKAPSKMTRKREIYAADGSGTVVGWEDYVDYVFPDDQSKPAALKLLELAQKWKRMGNDVAEVLQSATSESDGGVLGKRKAVGHVAQSAREEEAYDGAESPEYAKEVEREREDSLKTVSAGTRLPVDWYNEEDGPGDAADRDV